MKKEEGKLYKDLLKQKEKLIRLKHSFKMIQLKYTRESDEQHHGRELERGRIKTAEIRKSIERKRWGDFTNAHQNK